MLKWLEPRNFKSFCNPLPLAFSPFTLLVGANASGKSNVLEAIRFFQGLANGYTTMEVLEGVYRNGILTMPGIRGGGAEFAFRGDYEVRPQVGVHVDGKTFAYGVHMEQLHSPVITPHIWQEWLRDRTSNYGLLLEDVLNGEHYGRVLDEDGKSTPQSIPIEVDPGHSSLFRHDRLVIANDKVIQVSSLRKFWNNSLILNLNPARMREYASHSARMMGVDGSHLSAVLYRLCQEEGYKQDIVDWLSELCSPEIRDLDFIEVQETKDVLFKLIEKDGATVTARSVSDGTLRFLGLIAVLWSVEEGTLVCIEEPETGLHPSRIELLIELLLRAVEERHIQVVATTHSPRVLHALADQDEEALGNTIVLGRDAEHPGTIGKNLKDLPSFSDVFRRRGIEHLFTTRWLERAL